METKEMEDMKALLDLPKREFIKVCLEWIKEEHSGKLLDVKPNDCPLAIWVAHNNAKCHREFVPLTAACPICGNPMCPDCSNHVVDIVSRVTGYLGTVSGWNEAKKQEFEDRHRYELDGGS